MLATTRVDFPQSFRQPLASQGGPFKGLRTDSAEMAVAAGSVVKRLDLIEHIRPGQLAGSVAPLFNPFVFQTAGKRLGYGIIDLLPCFAGQLELD